METKNADEDILSLSSEEEDPYNCSDDERDADYVEHKDKDKTEKRKRKMRPKKNKIRINNMKNQKFQLVLLITMIFLKI